MRPDALSVSGHLPLDENVLASFPTGSKVLSAEGYGKSDWTITARIDVELPDGTSTHYFLKCATEERGRLMMQGEFNAMKEIHKTMPEFVPKPLSWGKYRVGNPDTYYFLQEFLEMSNRLPEPKQLCSKLAQLHKNSVSPTGKFGFHVTTCNGRTPQEVSWESTWTLFFSKLLRHVANIDFEVNGMWEALEILENRIFGQVIPRLIGILESDGRSIKPCLIHADLWEGNTGTVIETKNIYIFDSGAFYAHHEMEIGDWRCRYNEINKSIYTETYKDNYKPSEPKQEWDDRNRMYSVYFNLIYSVNHLLEGKPVRQTLFDDMYYLIDKYAPFPKGEGPPRIAEEDRVSLSTERDHTKS
ncbi:hypothetical protein G7Y79_00069g096520 [Physcia stellaris]|nr:hypothetical protein G7Y79_00069g096520 [Physcia stellaris]